jgi:hypothetical protein
MSHDYLTVPFPKIRVRTRAQNQYPLLPFLSTTSLFMTSTEARLGHLREAADLLGLSLGEYLALCIANEFVMDWQTVVSYLTKILEDCSEAPNGLAAVVTCIEKQWLQVVASGTLTVTSQGAQILGEISEVVHFAEHAAQVRPRSLLRM